MYVKTYLSLHLVFVEMKRIDFRTSPYFSEVFIFVGIFLSLIGIAALFIDIMDASILLFVGFMILSTHYRLAIDL